MCESKLQKLNRRNFLKSVSYGTAGVAASSIIRPTFVSQAFASQLNGTRALTNPILIVINLGGGPSYQLAPIYHSAWRDRNPNISYGPAESFPINSEQGLHPSFVNINQLYGEGDVALLNQVGFNNQSRSHSTAGDMWMKAAQNPMSQPGILNQLSCQMSGFFAAMSLAGESPAAEGSCNMRSISDLDSLNGADIFYSADETEWARSQALKVENLATSNDSTAKTHVNTSINNMDASAETIKNATEADLPDFGVTAPNSGLGRDAQDLLKVVNAGSVLATKIFYLQKGGNDTHSNEVNSMEGNMTDLDSTIGYLAAGLKFLNRWNDACIVVRGEFARTFENSAAGSDHGGPGPCYVMGGMVAGRQVNPAPTNSEIASATGFLSNMQIDTRQLWREIVIGMGYNPDLAILDTGYSTTPLGLFS